MSAPQWRVYVEAGEWQCEPANDAARAAAEEGEYPNRDTVLVEAIPVGGSAKDVVADFLTSWRYCPVSSSSNKSRACLEDAADQLLDALRNAT